MYRSILAFKSILWWSLGVCGTTRPRVDLLSKSVKSPLNLNFWSLFPFYSRRDNPFLVAGTGMENCIPKFWERDREWKKRSQLLGTGTGMKNSFPNFGNGNRRPIFPKMVGNGNSRSPLAQFQTEILEIFCKRSWDFVQVILRKRWK